MGLVDNDIKQQQHMIEILRKKLVLLQEFYQLTDLMQRSLSMEDMEEFNHLINKRQKIIDSINGFEREIILYQKITSPSHNANESASSEAEHLKKEIQVCLVQIHEIDQKVQQDLKQNYNKIVKSLGTLRTSKQAVAKYYKKNNQPQAFFIDKKK